MKIPVTILTGFLGSGKTTLVNRILQHDHGERVVVIVNEFGEVGIDERMILRSDEEVIELANGAICCMPKTETTQVLLKLVENKERAFDRVIIETTGLANPTPLVRAFTQKQALKERFRVDAVVTVVNAARVVDQLKATAEAKVQLASADLVILNKIDLVDEKGLALARMRVRRVNPIAAVVESTHSQVDIDRILHVGGEQLFTHTYEQTDEHHHDHDIQTVVLREERPLDLSAVSRWIGEELLLNHENLLRYKGFLSIKDMPERFVFQGVHEQFENRKDRAWNEDEDRVNEVVLIGKDLKKDHLQRTFSACVAE